MHLKKLFSKQRGDTIIEVMLAMSVIGLVLGSSYAIANRSVRIGREAQERTEALKQVETQIERLRTLAAIQDNGLVEFPSISAFCLDSSAGIVSFGDSPVSIEDLNTRTGYPDSGECYTGVDGRYAVSVTKSEDFLFTVRARWDPVGGGPVKELTASYRIYPSGSSVASTLFPVLPSPDPTDPQLPTVSLDSIAASNIQETAADVSIEILSSGESPVTEVGFVVDDSPISNINSVSRKQLVQLSGSHPFTYVSTFEGLTTGSTYYVRAYAVNNFGTVVSDQASFIPLAPLVAPAISTVTAQDQLNGSFVLSAEVLSAGNDISIQRGFIYSDSADFDANSPGATVVEVNGGEGAYNYTLTGLIKGQERFVRAYVTNDVDTTYSPVIAIEYEYVVGDRGPGGGAIFYKKNTRNNGWKYLEVARNDLTWLLSSNPLRSPWLCTLPMTGVLTTDLLGRGLTNSEAINNSCRGPLAIFSPAARGLGYSNGAVSDWYLPSLSELRRIYANRTAVEAVVNRIEGPYWSSTLQNPGIPLGLNFDNNQAYQGSSTSEDKIRLVRRF